MIRYDFAPLEHQLRLFSKSTRQVGGLDVDDQPTDENLATMLGCVRKVIWRARKNGLTATSADHLAVAAGFHPCEIWPEWMADPAEWLPGCRNCGSDWVLKGANGTEREFCSEFCRAAALEYRYLVWARADSIQARLDATTARVARMGPAELAMFLGLDEMVTEVAA